MLPYSTNTRKPRDITKGRLDGRSTEIQRLIGRSLRAVVDLEKLGPRTMWVDCDVLQADGGTRTAAITGASLAVAVACRRLVEDEKIERLVQVDGGVGQGVAHAGGTGAQQDGAEAGGEAHGHGGHRRIDDSDFAGRGPRGANRSRGRARSRNWSYR